MDAMTSKPAVETWPVDRLRPYERNSRRHSPEQIEQIAASIRQWGWTMPILAADDSMVLAGRGRLAAGKLLGFTQAPVIVARGWTDQQKRADVIADNRLTDASDWDDEMLRLELADLAESGFEIALTGITEDELSRLSVGVGELEQMPELPDGDRSPFRDMTFIVSVAPRPFRLFVRSLGSTVRRVIFGKGAHNGRPFGRHKTTVPTYRSVCWRRSKALAGRFEGTDCRGKPRAGRDCHRCRPPPWLPAPAGA
ncbi:ParB/Srx family N-terminal domain-containing protein [Bradyrhizobium sp. ISRA443]|uniref:ParB/Srx family N-terminal domain-containing protein n=1 Tax=unclassified Bradyrhizobium TaxID=2631580 RepID=UPI0032B00661